LAHYQGYVKMLDLER